MSDPLTHQQIVDITHKVQHAAQLRHLRRMGIRAERRWDGTVLVLPEWLADRPVRGAKSTPRLTSDIEREQAAQAR